MDDTVEQIAELFEETGKAHHQAFIETDGDDPEWPLWYAERMKEPLGELLTYDFTISELIYWLFHLDKVYREKTPAEPWATYYGNVLVNEFVDA